MCKRNLCIWPSWYPMNVLRWFKVLLALKHFWDPLKHLLWNFLLKYLTSFSCYLFLKRAPSQIFDRLLNKPMYVSVYSHLCSSTVEAFPWVYKTKFLSCGHDIRCQVCSSLFLNLSYFTLKDKIPVHHCIKSVRIWSYSGLYFPAFGLNTERYSVYIYVRIGENVDQNNSKYWHFSRIPSYRRKKSFVMNGATQLWLKRYIFDIGYNLDQ